MKKRSKFLISLLVIVILSTILFVIIKPINHQGEKSKEALVKAYLSDLTNNDSQAILELTPSDYESHEAVQQVIKKYGGNEFKNITIKYLQSESTGIWFALITGVTADKTGKNYQYKEQLTLREGQEDPYTVVYDPQNPSISRHKKPDRWVLLLGEQKSALRVSGSPLKIRR